ncbi:hypothetical protein GOP47_0003003 [Adiantum capillus-veneris]|uniref:BHLH domain-containing protein n=1 Tax=Adiantum capillus-veneris TaxID=13818 RepID=A0A9D4ZS44_ADICA|nr:hypothetical protein GOP47_0003003 [Adiantum capillus-veneris]
MDDIFEQMLSTSPWGDGVGMPNRAGWDGSVNNMGMDSSQSLPKVPGIALNTLMGGLSNQGMGRALQDNSGTMHADGIFDGGHGVHAPHHMQAWNQPYLGGVPPAPSMLSRGKPDTYLLQGEGMRRDIHLGKRVRDDEDMLIEGHPDNMIHVSGVPGAQGYGDQGPPNEDPAGPSSNAPTKPRVRARRGQATDPHSIAERNRRERIAERLRALQELVPDSNKTDKASMLDEIIGYVKFLQMQVKCLSMCRLGGAGAAVPLLADLPGEGASNFLAAANLAQAHAGALGASQEGMAMAERQVAQLMDEDMSAAMQYLQSKGLCLMPISLATAISSTGARQQAAPARVLNSGGNGKQTTEAAAASVENDNVGKSGGTAPPKPSKDTQKEENCG